MTRSPGDAALLRSAKALRSDARTVSRASQNPFFALRNPDVNVRDEAASARAHAAMAEASGLGDVLATPADRRVRGELVSGVSAPSHESQAWLSSGVEPAFAAMVACEVRR